MTKHKAIIKKGVFRKEYTFDDFFERVHCNHILLRQDTLWEGEIDTPLLNSDEELYITDLDLTVKIKSRIRTTENEFIYHTNQNVVIEDEHTDKSFYRANLSKVQYKREKEEEEERERRMWRESVKNPIKKPWYKRLFKKE